VLPQIRDGLEEPVKRYNRVARRIPDMGVGHNDNAGG
jgi:hypothetical protein